MCNYPTNTTHLVVKHRLTGHKITLTIVKPVLPSFPMGETFRPDYVKIRDDGVWMTAPDHKIRPFCALISAQAYGQRMKAARGL